MIVGAGVIGAATAFHLSLLGAGAPAGSIDLAPFRPDRLSDGRPIEPPNPYSDD